MRTIILATCALALAACAVPVDPNHMRQMTIHRSIASVGRVHGSGPTGPTSGCGVLISREQGQTSLVVTALHIVPDGDVAHINFGGQRFAVGRVVMVDRAHDLALIEVGGAGLPAPMDLAPPGSVQLGMTVYAVGAPRGFYASITRGIVSGLGRAVGRYGGLIQMDAAINPGNSGGALVDARGRLVGIPTMKYLHAEGMGFSQHVRHVRALLEKYRLARDRLEAAA